MNHFLKRYRLVMVATVFILMALLLHLRAQNLGRFSWVDRVVMGVFSPLTNGAHAIGTTTTGWLNNYVLLVGVKAENTRLRARIAALEEEVHHHLESSIQYQLLKEQLVFLQSPLVPKVFAQVIGQSLDGQQQTLLINKGLSQGVRRNFPVVLREGVVGRIQTVANNQAIVQLILDRRHRFPVLLRPNVQAPKAAQPSPAGVRSAVPNTGPNAFRKGVVSAYRGVVVGHGNSLSMQRVPALTPVHQGDRVVTSGLAGVFPKGLLVGHVISVRKRKHELFQTAFIKPAVNFKQVEGVFVVLRGTLPNSLPYFSQTPQSHQSAPKR